MLGFAGWPCKWLLEMELDQSSVLHTRPSDLTYLILSLPTTVLQRWSPQAWQDLAQSSMSSLVAFNAESSLTVSSLVCFS